MGIVGLFHKTVGTVHTCIFILQPVAGIIMMDDGNIYRSNPFDSETG